MNDLHTLGKAMRDAQRAYYNNPPTLSNLTALLAAQDAFDKALSTPPAKPAALDEWSEMVRDAFVMADALEAATRQRDEAERRRDEAREALKDSAADQVKYWRDSQIGKPSLEDAVRDAGDYKPIGDEAAWDAGYRNGRYSEADWWQKKIASIFAALSGESAAKEPAPPKEGV